MSKKFIPMKIYICVLITFMALYSCHKGSEENHYAQMENATMEMMFDADKWKVKEGKDFPYRNGMFKELMTNQEIRKLNKKQILDLLGEPQPDRPDPNYLYYRISETRIGSWPLHTKTLVIKFTEDDTIDWMKIHR